MQKIIGAILIILASGGIGVTKGLELQKYLRELELLKQLFWMLKREIQYTKAPFSEAFSHIGRRMEGAQGEWLLYLAEQIEEKAGATFFELWTESIDRCLIKSQLKNKDKEELKAIGMQMGYLDEQMQLGTIDLYLEQLSFVIQKTREELVMKKRLCNCLGVMGGIFLVIILIEVEAKMSVNLIFKIAAVGILVSVLSQVLKHSGREEQAFLTSFAGLLLVLFWIVPYIYELFESIKRLFSL